MARQRLRSDPPESLSSDARALYDRILATRQGMHASGLLTADDGSLLGPFGPLTHAPPIGMAVQEVGTALRQHGTLPPAAVETVILTVATHRGAQYEWDVHRSLALASGALSEEDLRRIAAGVDLPDPDARAAGDVARDLLETDTVADETYERARARFGDAGLVELVVLVGYYSLLAALIETFAPAD